MSSLPPNNSAPADDDDDDAPRIPAGSKNYMTPAGFEALQTELRTLLRVERPKVVEIVAWAAGNGDRSENGDYLYGKKRLREIDRRVRFLTKRLESAEVVDPTRQTRRDQVFFGATVTFARDDETERTVTIVGIDEADMDKGKVSWISPIARALLKARVGDVVLLRTPAGPEEIEVISILYPGDRHI
ncbi:transcription elongation factor GreB [Oleisolibacter albus]|uniref:transcription elongation factor GreB n=1 Tax=Oleisolibacter albus TaxID=2171757 RepID=UPI000DF35E49|nr:transcription elongation factor GreB [Oleisolibacter albus]